MPIDLVILEIERILLGVEAESEVVCSLLVLTVEPILGLLQLGSDLLKALVKVGLDDVFVVVEFF